MSAARTELEQFLTLRLISRDSSWVGISSDAMDRNYARVAA